MGAIPRQNPNHVAHRALNLILLNQFLMIVANQRIYFQVINVLSQIAFTYFLSYLIVQLRFRWQVASALFLLALHSALCFVFPGPQGPFSETGNVGQVIDKAPLDYNCGGPYVTVNLIPSTVTRLSGAWTGNLLGTEKPLSQKLKTLAIAVETAFASSWLLSLLVPKVERIWRPPSRFTARATDVTTLPEPLPRPPRLWMFS